MTKVTGPQKKKKKKGKRLKLLRIYEYTYNVFISNIFSSKNKIKLHFTTLNYHHFFNPPPKLQKVTIDPPIASNCTTVTPLSPKSR